MDNNSESQGFFDKPENIKKMLRVFYAICIGLVVVDFIVHRHIYHDWENIPAFYAVYGFVGCVVLVLIAKEMRKFLMRKEDYYDE
jgi:cell division protein FtsW (lipid II flippase)